MLETLLAHDAAAQRWVEEHLRASWLDLPMHVLSTFGYFAPLAALALAWLIWKGGARGRRLALAAVLLVIVTDQLSASVLKPLFARPRPHSPAFGFPSSHAANSFGQATLFAHFYPRWTAAFVGAACAVAFSRIYLGKHYPLDTLAGALLGAACALGAMKLLARYGEHLDRAFERVHARWRGGARP
jgi:undecaprenyl-diphosphatase